MILPFFICISQQKACVFLSQVFAEEPLSISAKLCVTQREKMPYLDFKSIHMLTNQILKEIW